MHPTHPRSTLFPYTTLFRSQEPLATLIEMRQDVPAFLSRNSLVHLEAMSAGQAGRQCYGRLLMAGNAADRKSTRLNSSHVAISYAVFCLKKKNERLTSGATL